MFIPTSLDFAAARSVRRWGFLKTEEGVFPLPPGTRIPRVDIDKTCAYNWNGIGRAEGMEELVRLKKNMGRRRACTDCRLIMQIGAIGEQELKRGIICRKKVRHSYWG